MSNILYLVHRIPFPPDKGDKIRSYHFLRFLSRTHKVHLGAFVDNADDWRFEAQLQEYCSSVFLRPIGGWGSKIAAASALLQREPISTGYYADAAMRDWVQRIIRVEDIDVMIVFSATMAQYFPKKTSRKLIRIADFVDVDSDKWRQFADRGPWPKSILYRYEAEALARWEKSVLQQVDAVTLISHEERNLILHGPAVDSSKIVVIPNGVNLKYFDPTLEFDNPYPRDVPVVVFTGAMDYFANEDAVCWFANSVWPLIRGHVRDVEFWVVGSDPTSKVLSLSGRAGITVTGRVSDVRPFLRFATVAVAPLRLARGMQNKVVEALAMNLPVIAVPKALQGLGETSECASIVAASGAELFAAAVLGQLERVPAVAAGDGRRYVESKFDWASNLARVEGLIPQ